MVVYPTSNPSSYRSQRVAPGLGAIRSASVINHSRFYFDDTLVVIQIEDVRFKVHKYQLIKSETFADMFAIAEQGRTEGGTVEGTSDENPIQLEGVSSSDFECLLAVLYAGHFSTDRPEPEPSLIIPAFRLANMWNFANLRAYLMPLAEKVLGDVDKIVFAREFNLDSWIAPAYTSLCKRREPLDSKEASKIGIEGVLLVSRVREEILRYPPAAPPTGYESNEEEDPMPSCDEMVKGMIDTWLNNGCKFPTVSNDG